MTTVISMVNHKGAQLKSSGTVNIGHGLANKGFRTLLIDLDFQANTTIYLLGEIPENDISKCLIEKFSINDVLISTGRDNLFIVPSSERLAEADLTLQNQMNRERLLQHLLDPVLAHYDFILIDNAPNLSLLTINSLLTSTHYIIPVATEFLPLFGMKLIERTTEKVRDSFKIELPLLGIIPTMVDKRLKITSEILDVLNRNFPGMLMPEIRQNVRMKEAPAYNQTVYESGDSKGLKDFEDIVEDILIRLGMKNGK